MSGKTQTKADQTRRQRVPYGGARRKLEVLWKDRKFIDGWVARWFNDQDGSLIRAEQAGYQFVSPSELAGVGDKNVHSGNTDLNSRVSRVVGRSNANNEPIRAFLMKIKSDWYDEDQLRKEDNNARIDEAIRAGTAGGADITNQYGKVDLRRD